MILRIFSLFAAISLELKPTHALDPGTEIECKGQPLKLAVPKKGEKEPEGYFCEGNEKVVPATFMKEQLVLCVSDTTFSTAEKAEKVAEVEFYKRYCRGGAFKQNGWMCQTLRGYALCEPDENSQLAGSIYVGYQVEKYDQFFDLSQGNALEDSDPNTKTKFNHSLISILSLPIDRPHVETVVGCLLREMSRVRGFFKGFGLSGVVLRMSWNYSQQPSCSILLPKFATHKNKPRASRLFDKWLRRIQSYLFRFQASSRTYAMGGPTHAKPTHALLPGTEVKCRNMSDSELEISLVVPEKSQQKPEGFFCPSQEKVVTMRAVESNDSSRREAKFCVPDTTHDHQEVFPAFYAQLCLKEPLPDEDVELCKIFRTPHMCQSDRGNYVAYDAASYAEGDSIFDLYFVPFRDPSVIVQAKAGDNRNLKDGGETRIVDVRMESDEVFDEKFLKKQNNFRQKIIPDVLHCLRHQIQERREQLKDFELSGLMLRMVWTDPTILPVFCSVEVLKFVSWKSSLDSTNLSDKWLKGISMSLSKILPVQDILSLASGREYLNNLFRNPRIGDKITRNVGDPKIRRKIEESNSEWDE